MNTNEQVTVMPKPSALSIMADRCNVDPVKLHNTLKNTVFKGSSDDELLALVVTSNIYQLNPFLKEIYAFPKKGGGIVPLVGFDGWVKIANRQENFDGLEVEVFGSDRNPTHATCKIHLKDRTHPVEITEYFTECHRPTDPWNQMPRRMMRNKAIIQAIRVAFGVAGIHDEDEASDIGMRDVTPRQDPQPVAYTPQAALPEGPVTQPAKRGPGRPPKTAAVKPEPPPPDEWREVTLVSAGIACNADGVTAEQGRMIRWIDDDGVEYSATTFSTRLLPIIGRTDGGKFVPAIAEGAAIEIKTEAGTPLWGAKLVDMRMVEGDVE